MADIPADLEAKIKRILVERLFLEVDPETLGADEKLTETYGVDSVRLFDMVVGLEEDFGVSFADNELALAEFDSVAAITAKLRDKIAAK
jgi:acyl carrier protein